MLQIYSIVNAYTLKQIKSQACITKTYHEGKHFPLGTFVLKRNFPHVHFSDKLKPLRIGPYKILDRLSEITFEFLSQDGTTSHIHRNHLIPNYPKERPKYPQLRNIMQFSDSISLDIPKHIKYANSDSSPFISDTSVSEDEFPNTTYPSNPDTTLNDTSSLNTILKTHDTNPSHIRIRHPTDSSSHTDPS